jgi:hypothetical protein
MRGSRHNDTFHRDCIKPVIFSEGRTSRAGEPCKKISELVGSCEFLRRDRGKIEWVDKGTDILLKGFNMRAGGYLRKVIKGSSYRFPLMAEIELIEKLVATRAIGSACRIVFRNFGSILLPEVKLQRGIISEIAS